MTTQKSDSWDAECVARILLNKLNHLPDAKPHDLFWSIQQLVTRRNALVKAQGALKNQLHIQLSHHYPSYKKFFSEVDGKKALAFWKLYPSPSSLDGVNVKKLTTFLLEASNNTCLVKKANEILKLVKDGWTYTERTPRNKRLFGRKHCAPHFVWKAGNRQGGKRIKRVNELTRLSTRLHARH